MFRPGATDGDAVAVKPPPFTLRWEDVEASDLVRYPSLLDELRDRTRDGVTIRNVFTADEVERALTRSEDRSQDRTDAMIGKILGIPIGEVGAESRDRRAYFADTERCRLIYRDLFGFDPHERIASLLLPTGGGKVPVVPHENGQSYNPGQMRWFEPGKGGLRAHAGNEFREIFKDGAMNHLVETAHVTDHLSYFVVLARPEEGGELTVYDRLWSPDAGDIDSWEFGERDDAWIESTPSVTIDPGPGDMALFGGGWRWHRVEPIGGSTPRITYGGFCAPSVNGAEVVFWT